MKPNNVTCYIPVEVKSRELDTKLYLALCLVERGFSVVIGRKTSVHNFMFLRGKPFIYFDKGISNRHWNFYNAIRFSNGLMVEIQEEGNISKDNLGLVLSHNNHCAQLFSLIFTWGKQQRDIIAQNCLKLNESILKVSGHPSFDLLHKDLIDYYSKLAKLHNNKKEDYILINTNFGIFNAYVTFDESKKLNKEVKELYNKEKRKQWKILSDFQEKVLSEFLKMTKSLSKSFPEKKIIVRPHPVERLKTYQEEFKDFKNVSVIREGSAREWIIGAESVIHYDCTTGIESFIAGKNVISFCPFYDEKLIAKLPFDISVKIKTIDELIKYIKDDYQNTELFTPEIRKKKLLNLENVFANIRKKASSEIIANVEELCETWNSTRVSLLKQRYYLLSFRFTNLIKRIKENIQNEPVDKKNIKNLANSKFPYLKKSEVVDRLNIWYNHLDIKEKFDVNDLANDAYLIKQINSNK